MSRRGSLLGLLLIAVLGGTSATALAAGPSSGGSTVHPSAASSHWAWVTVRRAHSTYTPAAIDQGNSAHMQNSVKWFPAQSAYIVKLKGVGDPGGNMQVSALGSNRICSVVDAAGETGNELVYVACFTASGAPSGAKFTLSFFATDSDAGSMAYLLADQSGETDYTPLATYSFNSSTGANTVHREGVGQYEVTLGGLAASGGDVQVTGIPLSSTARSGRGVWPAGTALTARVCKVTGWSNDGAGGEKIGVSCFDSIGAPADATFMLSYVNGEGAKGSGKGKVAYLWADQESATSYEPSSVFRFSQPAGTYMITSQVVGIYSVHLSTMPKGGSVHVTAHGVELTRCNVASISTTTPQVIGVRCFDFSGSLADSPFVLSYER